MIELINGSAEFIRGKTDIEPEKGLILGSGLGVLADEIKERIEVPYQEIPDFPVSTVKGHNGQFVVGKLEGVPVVAMQGRFHYYEGYSLQQIILPVRVMKKLGIDTIIITNAAGGINRSFNPGDFMIISDHINLMGDNPLRGRNLDEFGPRFPDMSEAYDRELIKLAERVAAAQGIIIRKGVYAAMTGPSFETPAEIRYLAGNGADAVGMSTVPEVIAARHLGITVLGISCITNMAAGILPQPLSHEEVIETTERVKPLFTGLVKAVIAQI
ncbi:MAG: purine-nucleoside phosphorylase [Halanaerobiales bacterium]